jgi:hypothetical protein
MTRLAPLLLALALLPACQQQVTYSYFVIHAKLDSTVDFGVLDRIEACAVLAQTPVRQDQADMHCKRHSVTSDLGTFEYSTSLTSGAIKFELVANDFNGVLLAHGQTPPLDIEVGKTVKADLIGSLAPSANPPEPDAGTTASTPDASAD